MTRKLIIGAATLTALLAGGGAAVAAGHQDGGRVPDPERGRAVGAALDATDGGTANSVERDSENGATWEVEVTRTDGSTVDVRLDAQYQVVVIEGDHEDSGSH
jgi:hypothetical protein